IPDSRFPIPDSRFPIPQFDNCLLLLIIVLIKINFYNISKIWITAVKPDLISDFIVIITSILCSNPIKPKFFVLKNTNKTSIQGNS
ncbi:MAG: hypothetical protein F6J98_15960, partial [Moorea sp. SIO4G2]|nr:hypothetical protein [Moorena sp. SIO4G2]